MLVSSNSGHFASTVDEELEEKPKKRRKRMKELPKEDSSDDGKVQVLAFCVLESKPK